MQLSQLSSGALDGRPLAAWPANEASNSNTKDMNSTKLTRRSLLRAGLTAAALFPLHTSAAPRRAAKTFVLVHGAWHGGWCWREVAQGLLDMGHSVSAPTQTGLGERRHLIAKDITLDTFIADVANHIETEELDQVILVGHSFGGVTITGVADKIPDRIRHLVYLDSTILQNGQTVFDVLPPDVVAARRKLAADQGNGIFLPAPAITAFGIPEGHRLASWVKRRMTPHPINTFESPRTLQHPVGHGRPCTYITCTDPIYAPLEGVRQWAKKQTGWNLREIGTAHDAMVTAPKELARMLADIG